MCAPTTFCDKPPLLLLCTCCCHQLRELDIAGNPCAKRSAAHHQVVMQLPRVRQLDGEPVTALDKDLAAMYFAKAERRGKSQANQQARPSTAPSSGGARALQLAGDSALFRSKELNSNPTVIKYLAQSTLEHAFDTAATDADSRLTSVSPVSHHTPAATGGSVAALPSPTAASSSLPVAPPTAIVASSNSRRAVSRKGSSSRLRGGQLPRPRSLRRLTDPTTSLMQLASEKPPLPSPSMAASASVLHDPTAAGGSSGGSAVSRLRGMRRSRPTSTGSATSTGSIGSAGSAGSSGSAGHGLDVGASGSGSGSGSASGSGPGGDDKAGSSHSQRRTRSRSGSGGDASGGVNVNAGTGRRGRDASRRRSAGSSSVDLSDPHVTIRKLLKTVEVLQVRPLAAGVRSECRVLVVG